MTEEASQLAQEYLGDLEELLKISKVENGSQSTDLLSVSLNSCLENLMSSFDDIVSICFQERQEVLSLAETFQSPSNDESLTSTKFGRSLTMHFNQLTSLDWSRSHLRQTHQEALLLCTQMENNGEDFVSFNEEDDELIRKAFNFHSMVTHELPEDIDPVKTADQVISEIEMMMMDDDDFEMMQRSENSKTASLSRRELQHFRESHLDDGDTINWCQDLDSLSLGALNELLEDMEDTVQHLNELLVYELAIREELNFHKETKESFLSLLVKVSKRKQMIVKRNKLANVEEINANQQTPTQNCYFLTTEIPFHQNCGPPSHELLHVYNKILQAMLEDNAQGPQLLADYILKVHLPAVESTALPKLRPL